MPHCNCLVSVVSSASMRSPFCFRIPYLGGGSREAGPAASVRPAPALLAPTRVFSLTALKKTLEKNSDTGGIVAILAQLESFGQQGKQAPGEWAACFGEGPLRRLAGPVTGYCQVREYQALKVFQDKVLNGLAALDAVLPAITRGRGSGFAAATGTHPGISGRSARPVRFRLSVCWNLPAWNSSICG